jgi:hypothetical protein
VIDTAVGEDTHVCKIQPDQAAEEAGHRLAKLDL